jgi:hypothetical protein
VGLTAKQEAFAQAVAGGSSNVEAYRAHYKWQTMLPTTLVECASRVAHSHKVAARIAELKAQDAHELAVARVWDKVRFVEEAEENLEKSRDLGQMAPANGALQMIGKVTGILQDQPASSDTALDAVLKVAAAMTDAALRAQAQGLPGPEIVDGKSHVVSDE